MNVFKIVLPGNDVKHSSPAEEVISSLQASPKIDTRPNPAHTGIVSVNWSASGITLASGVTKILYSFPHGYGYTPSCFASYAYDNGSTKSAGTLPIQVGAQGLLIIDCDDINIYFKYFSTDRGSPLTAVAPFLLQIRYYVMAERGYE